MVRKQSLSIRNIIIIFNKVIKVKSTFIFGSFYGRKINGPFHRSPCRQAMSKVITRHCNFSRETGKREICRREISHGKIRREKREIVKSKIRVFWPKLK